jgi:hypothetical protein
MFGEERLAYAWCGMAGNPVLAESLIHASGRFCWYAIGCISAGL